MEGVKNGMIQLTLLIYYVADIVGCIKSFDGTAIDVGCEKAQIGLLWLLRGNTKHMLQLLMLLQDIFRFDCCWRQMQVIYIIFHLVSVEFTFGFTIVILISRATIYVRQNIKHIRFHCTVLGLLVTY